MKKLSLIALLSTISLSAFAVEPCKPYMSINAGYSWGFNGKSDFMMYDTPTGYFSTTQVYSFNLDKNPKGLITSVNFGYGFNDAMRAEVGLDWNPKMKSTIILFDVETKEIGGHGTVAYDFNNNTPVTPFLFGSLGFSSIKHTIKATSNKSSDWLSAYYHSGDTYSLYDAPAGTAAASPSTSLSTSSKTLMTYKVGMGLSMKAGQGVDLEVRYGLGGKADFTPITDKSLKATPKFTTGVTNVVVKSMKVKKAMDHSLTAGVRFTF